MREVKLNSKTFNYILYTSQECASSDVFVVQLHGSGEVGNIDGSTLTKVEKYGYANRWNQGERYPFKLIAPQATSENYKNIMLNIEAELLALGAKKIIYTGWSKGAIVSIQALDMNPTDSTCTHPNIKSVSAVVAMAGNISCTPDYNKAKDVPFILVHGTDDTVVKYNCSKRIAEEFSILDRVNETILYTIEGGNHNSAVSHGYDRNSAIGKKVYEMILTFCSAAPEVPARIPIVKTEFDPGLNKIVFTGVNGVEY